jgi:hypothetical protein
LQPLCQAESPVFKGFPAILAQCAEKLAGLKPLSRAISTAL